MSGAGTAQFGGGMVAVGGTYNITGTSTFTGATVNFNAPITSLGTGPLSISGGVVNFNSNDITVPAINLSSGTLGGSVAAINSTGLLTWSGGTMSGSGMTNADGGISLVGGGTGVLIGRTLNNALGQSATLSGASATLNVGSGAVFNNLGTFLAQNNQAFANNGGAASTFNNPGTFTRNTGTGTFSIALGGVFNNTGTVNVQTGTLFLNTPDAGNTTGDFNISSGATLQFNSNYTLGATSDVSGAGTVQFSTGTVNVGGTYNITGATSFTGANVNFNSPITSLGAIAPTISIGTINFGTNNLSLPALNQSGGTLTGTGSIDVGGLLTWSGGIMSGTGVTNANGGLSLTNSTHALIARTLNNAAGQTATLSGASSSLGLGTGASFNNNGTFLAQNDQSLTNQGGAASAFNNAGTFTRNTATGTFSIALGGVFNNTGTVNVQTGTLFLNTPDAGNTTGDFNISSGATLQFNSNYTLGATSDVSGAGTVQFSIGTVNVGGTYNITGATSFTGANVNFNSPITSLGAVAPTISIGTINFGTNNLSLPALNQSGGTLTGTGSIDVGGLLTWGGGAMSGTGTTNANGGISLSGGTMRTLSARTLNNAAGQTATLSGASSSLSLGTGATFNNNGTFLAQNDQSLTNQGGAASAFNNAGTFTRNTATGTFSIALGGVFNNTGTVNVQTGTLAFSTPVTQYTGTSLTAGTWKVFANSVLNLQTTGTGIVTNQADITLSGAGSIFRAGASSATLESKLVTNSGALRVLAGRDYTAPSAVNSSGVLQLGGGTFVAPSLTSTATGELFGFGSITPRPTNSGLIRASGGTLAFGNGILGGSGTVQIDAGSVLNLSGGSSASSADFLIHNGDTGGSLNLGTNNFTANVDYTNASYGVGNSFNPRANVSGAGQIQAFGGTGQSLSGNVTSGGTATPVMTFGNVHVGSTSTLNYQINNTGASGSRLRGALQTTVNGGNITDPKLSGSGVTAGNFGPLNPGASTSSLAVVYTPNTVGALSGQTVRLLNNFDNVGDQTLSITGAAYRLAAAGAHTPEPVNFGNVHVGAAPSQALTISNIAAADGFSESLNASFGGTTGGVITNGGSFTLLAPGASNNSALAVGISTASAGSKNGTATINLTSDGTGSSGLGTTALTRKRST